MRPISPHDRFFSSLNQAMHTLPPFNLRANNTYPKHLLTPLPPQLLQVEKRMASEKESASFATSPLYLSSPKPQPASSKPSALEESSGPAPEFLSISPPTIYDRDPPLAAQEDFEDDEEDDEIDRLISLLGLCMEDEEGGGLGSCHCSGGGFYRRAVGLKGPICVKEMERLDGWIEHFRRERREPARLAHLLLGKAVSFAEDDGFGGIGFPPTVEEFLERDPPFEKGNMRRLAIKRSNGP